MKVLICGGRNYSDWDKVNEVLSRYNFVCSFSAIVQGGATGADSLADKWAIENGVVSLSYPVSKDDWKKYGGYAGPRRNLIMLEQENPDLLIAFPGGKGTRDMIEQSRDKGINAIVIGEKA